MNTDSKPVANQAQEDRLYRYHDEVLRRRARINTVAFVITIFFALAYLVWAFVSVDYSIWYIGVPFLIAEVMCFASLFLWGGMMVHRREHPPQGLPLQDSPPTVDIIVTCCGEPLRVIEKTLRAVAEIDYPDFKITVADERADPQVGALCKELRFTHLCRPEHEDRKAGNLNYALSHTDNPFLLVLDSDQIPHRNILKVLMGYFSVPDIGFVTTYQGFDVPPGDPWGNRDRVFYGSMQPAKDYSNSAISCGSGVIYRRAALDDINGFSSWNLVEDLYSSMLIHAKGWKSVYHDFPLTHGTAPMEITAHVRQRWQWAVDSLRLFFWRNPMFTKGLTWQQKCSYAGFGYSYVIFGIAFPIFFLMPIWGLFSGSFFIGTTATEFVIWRAPYAVAYLILNRLITDGRHNMKTFRAQVGLFQVFLGAVMKALFSVKSIPKYTVSPKMADRPPLFRRAYNVAGHLLITGLCLAGIVYGYFAGSLGQPHFYVNTAWALWVVWLLLPFITLALKPPPEVEFR